MRTICRKEKGQGRLVKYPSGVTHCFHDTATSHCIKREERLTTHSLGLGGSNKYMKIHEKLFSFILVQINTVVMK